MTTTPAPQSPITDRLGVGTSRPPIGWIEVGIALLAALVAYGVGIGVIWAMPDASSPAAGIVQYLVSGLAPLAAVGTVALLRTRSLRPLGWQAVRPRWIPISIGLGLLAIVLNVALALVIVLTLLDSPTDMQAGYGAAASAGVPFLILTLLAGAVLTPLGEEALFRGVLANALGRYGAWVAVLGSAAIFAVAHGINLIMPVAFVVGIITALLFRRTGSIWPGVIVHGTDNAHTVLIDAVL